MLFCEIDSVNPITLAGVIVTLVGVIAWILKSAVPAIAKQYRDDVFAMNAERKAEVAALVQSFREELHENNERHDREMAKRDVLLEKLTASVDALAKQVSDRVRV